MGASYSYPFLYYVKKRVRGKGKRYYVGFMLTVTGMTIYRGKIVPQYSIHMDKV